MKLQRKVKRWARGALRGRAGPAAALFLLWAATWGAVSLMDQAIFRLVGHYLGWFGGAAPAVDWRGQMGALWISAAAVLVRAALLAPLSAGAAAWFSALGAGRQRSVSTLLWPYTNWVWFRSLGVRLYTGAVTGLVTLGPIGAAGGLCWLLRDRLLALSPGERVAAAVIGGIAAAVWLLLARVYCQRYALALLLIGPDYGFTAAEAIALSVRCTRGHRWRLVGLDLSFLPWFAACLLVVPALYVLPYYTACRVGYGQYLYHRSRRRARA